MAYYTTSNLGTAQAKLLGAFQSGELRSRNPVTFLEFIRNAQIMYPSYDQLRVREDRTVTAYYLKRASRSLTTARSHNHTGNRGDSGSLSPSWTTYSDPFSNSLKQGNNNVFDLQTMLNNDLQNSIKNFAEGTETLAAAYLFNNKSGVNAAAVDGAFDTTNDVYEIEADKEKRSIQIVQTVMDINKYAGSLIVFCDSVAWNKFNFYANQGSANAENLAFQFAGVRFVHSVDLTASALTLGYTEGFWIVVPDGMIGALPHIPKENRMAVNTKVNQYGTVLNPVDGLDYAIHSYETLADGSSYGGYTQDVVTQYQLSIDLAFDHAPLSASGETPLQAFAIIPTVA
jgi:hypothetical protein